MQRGFFDSAVLKRDTLQRFIAVILLSVCVAFVLLAMGWLLSVSKLHGMKQRSFSDAQSLSLSYQLELALRQAEVTQGLGAASLKSEARRVLDEMPLSLTSSAENAKLQDLRARFGDWEHGSALEPLLKFKSSDGALSTRSLR
ncbi:hypothetical protein EON80_29070 [bacterium]|nr:MAG: hypothetical protein EON80_29070 [bacterium]